MEPHAGFNLRGINVHSQSGKSYVLSYIFMHLLAYIIIFKHVNILLIMGQWK